MKFENIEQIKSALNSINKDIDIDGDRINIRNSMMSFTKIIYNDFAKDDESPIALSVSSKNFKDFEEAKALTQELNKALEIVEGLQEFFSRQDEKEDIKEFLLMEENKEELGKQIFDSYVDCICYSKAKDRGVSIYRYLVNKALDLENERCKTSDFINSILLEIEDKQIFEIVSDYVIKMYNEDFDELVLKNNYEYFVKIGRDIIYNNIFKKMFEYRRIITEASFEFFH